MINWIVSSVSLLSPREWLCALAVLVTVGAFVYLLSHDGFPPMDQ